MGPHPHHHHSSPFHNSIMTRRAALSVALSLLVRPAGRLWHPGLRGLFCVFYGFFPCLVAERFSPCLFCTC